MQHYRKTSHTTYDCKYHIVWITKYRKQVMVGLVAERVRELLRGICKEHEVEILRGHVSKDHVHLFVSVPPHLALSKLVQYLKGKTGPPVRLLQTFVRESAVVESLLGPSLVGPGLLCSHFWQYYGRGDLGVHQKPRFNGE